MQKEIKMHLGLQNTGRISMWDGEPAEDWEGPQTECDHFGFASATDYSMILGN